MFGIPNIEHAVSNFLESNKGITSVRSIEFEKKYLWVIDFVGNDNCQPPAPFDQIFPANDVTLPVAILESNSVQLPQTNFKHPSGSGQQEMLVTFYDDQKRTLLTWLSDWVKYDILNNGLFMSGLQDKHPLVTGNDSFGVVRNVRPLRTIRLALLDSYKDEVLAFQLQVYPDGNIDWNGGQSSDSNLITVNFVVAHSAQAKIAEKKGLFSREAILGALGRFI